MMNHYAGRADASRVSYELIEDAVAVLAPSRKTYR